MKPSDLSNTTRLHDDCKMPFGKYKSQPLGDVSDSYWRWFLQQEWCDEWPDLVQYANLVLDN